MDGPPLPGDVAGQPDVDREELADRPPSFEPELVTVTIDGERLEPERSPVTPPGSA
ncbi:MAG TPA: hypothetical protein VGI17_09720 [Solirubrobacterales bacterium]